MTATPTPAPPPSRELFRKHKCRQPCSRGAAARLHASVDLWRSQRRDGWEHLKGGTCGSSTGSATRRGDCHNAPDTSQGLADGDSEVCMGKSESCIWAAQGGGGVGLPGVCRGQVGRQHLRPHSVTHRAGHFRARQHQARRRLPPLWRHPQGAVAVTRIPCDDEGSEFTRVQLVPQQFCARPCLPPGRRHSKGLSGAGGKVWQGFGMYVCAWLRICQGPFPLLCSGCRTARTGEATSMCCCWATPPPPSPSS